MKCCSAGCQVPGCGAGLARRSLGGGGCWVLGAACLGGVDRGPGSDPGHVHSLADGPAADGDVARRSRGFHGGGAAGSRAVGGAPGGGRGARGDDGRDGDGGGVAAAAGRLHRARDAGGVSADQHRDVSPGSRRQAQLHHRPWPGGCLGDGDRHRRCRAGANRRRGGGRGLQRPDADDDAGGQPGRRGVRLAGARRRAAGARVAARGRGRHAGERGRARARRRTTSCSTAWTTTTCS